MTNEPVGSLFSPISLSPSSVAKRFKDLYTISYVQLWLVLLIRVGFLKGRRTVSNMFRLNNFVTRAMSEERH